jgi:hypothetical protein
MKDNTRKRKKVIRGIEEAYGRQWVCLDTRCYQEYGGVRGNRRNCQDSSIGEKLMRATQIISTKNLTSSLIMGKF